VRGTWRLVREAALKVLREGQCLRHELFGVGIALGSDEERTTIDFYEHGRKTFVTRMLDAELMAEAPPRPRGSKPRPRRKTGEER
jgi:hypothetical protein